MFQRSPRGSSESAGRQQANFSYSAAASFLQNIVGCAMLLLANSIIRRIDEDSGLG